MSGHSVLTGFATETRRFSVGQVVTIDDFPGRLPLAHYVTLGFVSLIQHETAQPAAADKE